MYKRWKCFYSSCQKSNNHFSQVGQKLEKNIGSTKKKYDNYLNKRVGNSFIIETTQNDDVSSVIKQFKNDKATGTNSESTILMKK